MQFENQKKFFSIIEVSKWENNGTKTTYKGCDVTNPILFYEELKKSYNNYTNEFQANEIIAGFEIYVHRQLYILHNNLQALSFYKKEELERFHTKSIDDVLHSPTKQSEEEMNDAIQKVFEDSTKYKLHYVEMIVDLQIEFTEKAIEYISASFLGEENKELTSISNAEPNYKVLYFKALEKLNANGQLSAKAHFDGRKIDLMNLFWTLQIAGKLTFERRRDFEIFLENNFTYAKGNKIAEVTAIQKEISEVLQITKDFRDRKIGKLRDDEKIAIQKKTEEKNKFLDALLKELKAAKLPPENGDDGFQ